MHRVTQSKFSQLSKATSKHLQHFTQAVRAYVQIIFIDSNLGVNKLEDLKISTTPGQRLKLLETDAATSIPVAY